MDKAIEHRARALAEADGVVWQAEFRSKPRYAKIELRPILDDGGRQKYRARAAAELKRESDNA
jgi:hypothetical protein